MYIHTFVYTYMYILTQTTAESGRRRAPRRLGFRLGEGGRAPGPRYLILSYV